MKINELGNEGYGFIIYPEGVVPEMVKKLLIISYMKAGVIDKNGICTENALKENFNSELPESFTEIEIIEMNGCVDDFISSELLESVGNGVYSYSEKMKGILKMLTKKQNEIDKEAVLKQMKKLQMMFDEYYAKLHKYYS